MKGNENAFEADNKVALINPKIWVKIMTQPNMSQDYTVELNLGQRAIGLLGYMSLGQNYQSLENRKSKLYGCVRVYK